MLEEQSLRIPYHDSSYYMYYNTIFRYILAGGGLTIMMGVRTDDVVYCPLPLYHSVGGMVSLSG